VNIFPSCPGTHFLAFALAGIWWGYFLLWALPLVTLVSFSMHSGSLPNMQAPRSTARRDRA
jgi:hypothetical protein